MKIYMIFLTVFFLSNIAASQTCPDGMISYWKFDEFGDVNTFLDSYGGINAFCSDPANCPVQDTGIVENARRFDGSDEVNVPDNNVYDWGPNTSFTIETWIKTSEPGTGNKVFVGKYQGDSKMSWWLGYGDNNKPIFSVRDSAGNKSEVDGETIINDGQWHHIVGIRNDSLKILQIFVDGSEEGKLTTFFTGDFSGTSPINIGHYAGGFYYTGLLDEIAVYNNKLNEDQITDHYNNGLLHKSYCDQSTDVEDGKNIPDEFSLAQNYPNPFNPSTQIKYSIPAVETHSDASLHVTLKVYDILGNEVSTLVDEEKPAGSYSARFKAEDLSSGIYFYQLRAGSHVQTKKMVILR